jgi:hypothetical protein
MRRLGKEAEAIREKRARIIKADGELEAAHKLNEAAAIIAPHPSAPELRRLQALTEIGVEHNSVIIVSLPVENNATAMSAAFAKSIAAIDVAASWRIVNRRCRPTLNVPERSGIKFGRKRSHAFSSTTTTGVLNPTIGMSISRARGTGAEALRLLSGELDIARHHIEGCLIWLALHAVEGEAHG